MMQTCTDYGHGCGKTFVVDLKELDAAQLRDLREFEPQCSDCAQDEHEAECRSLEAAESGAAREKLLDSAS